MAKRAKIHRARERQGRWVGGGFSLVAHAAFLPLQEAGYYLIKSDSLRNEWLFNFVVPEAATSFQLPDPIRSKMNSVMKRPFYEPCFLSALNYRIFHAPLKTSAS